MYIVQSVSPEELAKKHQMELMRKEHMFALKHEGIMITRCHDFTYVHAVYSPCTCIFYFSRTCCQGKSSTHQDEGTGVHNIPEKPSLCPLSKDG